MSLAHVVERTACASLLLLWREHVTTNVSRNCTHSIHTVCVLSLCLSVRFLFFLQSVIIRLLLIILSAYRICSVKCKSFNIKVTFAFNSHQHFPNKKETAKYSWTLWFVKDFNSEKFSIFANIPLIHIKCKILYNFSVYFNDKCFLICTLWILQRRFAFIVTTKLNSFISV